MSNDERSNEARDREVYYRFVYQVPPPPTIPGEMVARGDAYRDRALRAARLSTRVTPFRPDSDAAQLNYVRGRYGMTPPLGIGVRQGEYATLSADQVDRETHFIATDYLMDCHALVLVARDAQGRVQQTLLGHLDSLTDVAQAVPALLAHMPEGTQIEATIIGSPISINPYLQADLLRTLSQSSRVNHIRYDFDAATTVAVDTTTGRILTAAAPQETLATAYDIRELPVAIHFSPQPVGMGVRNLGIDYFRNQGPRSTLELHNVYQPGSGFVTEPLSAMVVGMQVDGKVDMNELQQLVAVLGQTLRSRVRLDYVVGEDGATQMTVSTLDGAAISHFTSYGLDPALGRSGSVRGP